MPEYPRFAGNCPRSVSKDAKYSVKQNKIGMIYETPDDEIWRATTEEHPELVALVNAVKVAHGNGPMGSFYINEYRQVIVPVIGSSHYYLAGVYDRPLRFEFEGKTLSGEPIGWDGSPLSPGDEWTGPHPGIPYVLAAGGSDIYYSFSPRPNVEKRVKLSKVIGPPAAAEVAAKIRDHKGYSGGRFYVNEFRSIFAPIQEGYDWRYVYIGELDLTKWFPMPEST